MEGHSIVQPTMVNSEDQRIIDVFLPISPSVASFLFGRILFFISFTTDLSEVLPKVLQCTVISFESMLDD